MMNTYKALVEIDVLEGNGKQEFFLLIHAHDSNTARKIAEREYPAGRVKFIVKEGTMASNFFGGHYNNLDTVVYSESSSDNFEDLWEADKKQLKTVTPDFLKDAIDANLKLIDDFASALDIMKKLGGIVDTDHQHRHFCQVNYIEKPEALGKIICMTRELVTHQITITSGSHSFLYFEMK